MDEILGNRLKGSVAKNIKKSYPLFSGRSCRKNSEDFLSRNHAFDRKMPEYPCQFFFKSLRYFFRACLGYICQIVLKIP